METLEKILMLIDSKGLDQQEFTRAIGIGKYSVSEWKNGKTQSYKKHIKKIADYLEVSADYLLGTEQKEKSLPPLSERDLETIEKIKALPPDKQKLVLEMIEGLRK